MVPAWSSRPWWTLVAPDGLHWANFVTDAVPLPRVKDLFLPGETSGNAVAQNAPTWDVWCLRIDFRPSATTRPPKRLRVWPKKPYLYE